MLFQLMVSNVGVHALCIRHLLKEYPYEIIQIHESRMTALKTKEAQVAWLKREIDRCLGKKAAGSGTDSKAVVDEQLKPGVTSV